MNCSHFTWMKWRIGLSQSSLRQGSQMIRKCWNLNHTTAASSWWCSSWTSSSPFCCHFIWWVFGSSLSPTKQSFSAPLERYEKLSKNQVATTILYWILPRYRLKLRPYRSRDHLCPIWVDPQCTSPQSWTTKSATQSRQFMQSTTTSSTFKINL